MLMECTDCGETINANKSGFCDPCYRDNNYFTVRKADRRNRIIGMIWQAASRGLPCPNNTEIATELDCTTGLASQLIRDLATDGLIRLSGGRSFRVATLMVSGVSTAPVPPGVDQCELSFILDAVASVFRCQPYYIAAPIRKSWIMPARFAFTHLAKESGAKLADISRFLSRDHSTVTHSISRADWMISRDPEFRAKVEQAAALSNAPVLERAYA